MASEINALNKWRINEFRKNNEPNKSPDKDFVCLSPKMYKEDPNVVFLSDSDENEKIEKLQKVDTDGLLEVRPLNRNRKRKHVVYANVSDSDDEVVVEKPRTRQTTRNNPRKTLLLKPASTSKKTAVVVPITKSNSHCEPQTTSSKLVDDKPTDASPLKSNSDTFVNGTSSAAVVTNGNTKVSKLSDSDSDLPLFEISSSNKRNGTDKVIKNPPPSPVDYTNSAPAFPVRNPPPSPVDYTNNSPSFPISKPVEDLISSSDSEDSVPKRKVSKGKQPANKRRKVVTKSSKPAPVEEPSKTNGTNQNVDNTSKDVMKLSAPNTNSSDIPDMQINNKTLTTPPSSPILFTKTQQSTVRPPVSICLYYSL